MHVFLFHVELVDPGLPEDLHSRHLSQPGRGIFVIHPSKQKRSIRAAHFRIASPLTFSLGKMILFYALTVAFKPFSRNPGSEPIRSDGSNSVEGCSQGFPQTL